MPKFGLVSLRHC